MKEKKEGREGGGEEGEGEGAYGADKREGFDDALFEAADEARGDVLDRLHRREEQGELHLIRHRVTTRIRTLTQREIPMLSGEGGEEGGREKTKEGRAMME